MDSAKIRNLLRLAKKGDEDATIELDDFYFDSDETKPFDRMARRCFYRGAKRGNTLAPYMLAKVYIRSGNKKELECCPVLFGLSISAGHGFVWNSLGYCHQEGIGTPKNLETAYKCYIKAFECGSVSGLLNAAHLCMFDLKQFDKAIKLYEKAAKNGSAMAAYSLAMQYELFEDIPHDAEKSIYWYRRAAELGGMNTNYEIGNIYADGKIIEKDMEKAVQYYKQGADAGDDECLALFAICLLKGEGTKKDKAEGMRLLEQAASMGNETAREELQKIQNHAE